MRLRAAALMVVGLVVAGCGGSSSADSSTESTIGRNEPYGEFGPHRADFLKAANQACIRDSNQIVKDFTNYLRQGTSATPAGKAREVEAIAKVLAPGLEGELEDIRALEFPSGEEAEIEAVLDAIQEAIDKAKADPKGFGAENFPYRKAENLGEAYGLTDCPML